ncbi:MAG: DUF4236 domain-containing protein [Balneolaceae bacterium]
MAFYIRKAFKTGPIRLNLSRGGLGLSGGMTGGRVGVNSRGLYVHGGRHGLYYRKYAKQGKEGRRSGGSGAASPAATRGRARSHDSAGGPVHSPVDLFRDTGVTYSSRTSELSRSVTKEIKLPSSDLLTAPVKGALWIAAILFVISLVASVGWLALVAILTAVGALGWMIRESLWKKQARKKLDEIVMITESEESFPQEMAAPDPELPERWKEWFSLHLHAVIGELAMSREEIDTLTTLQVLEEKVPVDKETTGRIRTSILAGILNEMLEDHLLSEEEEEAIRELINQLNLPEEKIASEKNRLEHYSRIRREIWRRWIPESRGSREYRLNRVLDVTADPEAGLVELTLGGRKSPVLITAPEPMVLAARIEKVMESL